MKWPWWSTDARSQFFKRVKEWKEETTPTKIDSKVILQGPINLCKMPEHLKNECPLNKESKKYKINKKILVETWSDCYSFSSDDESMIEAKANFCLMAKEKKVCNNDFNDLDILQHEYDCLFF